MSGVKQRTAAAAAAVAAAVSGLLAMRYIDQTHVAQIRQKQLLRRGQQGNSIARACLTERQHEDHVQDVHLAAYCFLQTLQHEQPHLTLDIQQHILIPPGSDGQSLLLVSSPPLEAFLWRGASATATPTITSSLVAKGLHEVSRQ